MITIVGGLPEPVGGVTNFLYRFTVHFKDQISRVVDLYPAQNKWAVAGLDCVVRPNSKLLSAFWVFYQMYLCEAGMVYFNFSSPRSLLLLLLLPKRAGVSWALTLHHGELSESLSKISMFWQRLAKRALQRVDRVGYISEKQHEFYNEIGFALDGLFRISTYLPYVDDGVRTDDYDGEEFQKKLEEFKGRFTKLVVASGYSTRLYRHDWVLSYFEETQSDVGLLICLYGPDSEGMLQGYKEWAQRLPNVILFEGLSPRQFQQVLSSSDIYVRPTLTDSYGVAVAEALECGLAVIASNACSRTAGANIFDCNDRRQFEVLLAEAINGSLERLSFEAGNSKLMLERFLGTV